MNSKVDEFLSCLNNEIENKTDKYWLEKVVFEIGDDKNLSIVVNSEFIKNSIEKKVLDTIKKVYQLFKKPNVYWGLDVQNYQTTNNSLWL